MSYTREVCEQINFEYKVSFQYGISSVHCRFFSLYRVHNGFQYFMQLNMENRVPPVKAARQYGIE